MVHVKDLVFKEGAAKRFTADKVVKVDESVRRVHSRIPGEGIVPWPKILAVLAAQGFAGWLSLEYERRWHPDDLPPAEDGMQRGAAYIRSVMRALTESP
jgi:sugar phosphate isomerase/epimerase